jgi:hypothetical protein
VSRMIRTDNSLYSLQMKCFYISSEYEVPKGFSGHSYIKDIFDD